MYRRYYGGVALFADNRVQRPLPNVDPHDETLCWMYRNVTHYNRRTRNLNGYYNEVLPEQYDAIDDRYLNGLPIQSFHDYKWMTVSHRNPVTGHYLVINIFYPPDQDELGALTRLDWYYPGAVGQPEVFVSTNYPNVNNIPMDGLSVSWNNIEGALFNGQFVHVDMRVRFNNFMRKAIDILLARYLHFPLRDDHIMDPFGIPLRDHEDWIPEYYDLIVQNLNVGLHTPLQLEIIN